MKSKLKQLSFLMTVSILLVGALLSFSVFAEYQPPEEKFDVTIDYWSFPHGPGYQGRLKELAKTFEEKTGIKVNTTVIPWGDGNTKLLSSIAAGKAPDVMYTTPGRGLAIINAGENVIEPLGKYIEDSGIEEEVNFPQALNTYNFYGKTYALGHYGDPHQWAINKNAFEKAGIDQVYIEKMTDPDKVWTWTDFIYLARKLTADTNDDGDVDQWGFVYPGGTQAVSSYLAFSWNIGENIVDLEGNVGIGSHKYTLPIMQLLDLLKKQGSLTPGCTSMSRNEAQSAYIDGKAAIISSYPDDQVLSRKEAGKDVSGLEPVYPPQAPTGERGIFFAWNGVMMSADSDHKQAAWEFIKYLVTSEDYEKMVMNGAGSITPISTTESMEEHLDPIYQKNVKIGLDVASRGWDVRFTPVHPALSRITRAYNSAVQSVLTGERTPIEATNWVREESLKAVEESG